MGGLTPENTAAQKQAYRECGRIAPYMLGDYFPLTPYSREHDQWIAWQFHRQDLGGGVVQAFRRKECPAAAMTFRLKGLDPGAQYVITDFDLEGSKLAFGAELMQKGLTVKIDGQPGAAIVMYSELPSSS
jgi:alpha-galactosidase